VVGHLGHTPRLHDQPSYGRRLGGTTGGLDDAAAIAGARISAWWTTRSMREVAVTALGKMVGHSLKRKLVVSTRLLRS
jgi:hypothetical protein